MPIKKGREVRAAQRLKSGPRSEWRFRIDLPFDEDVVIKTNGVLLKGRGEEKEKRGEKEEEIVPLAAEKQRTKLD